ARRHGPALSRDDRDELRWWPGRGRNACGRALRAARRHRRHHRAVPDPARLPPAHAARALAHLARLPPPRPCRTRARPGTVRIVCGGRGRVIRCERWKADVTAAACAFASLPILTA